jgi:heme/copper-type cytochrome/quinol oxidase subunit 3
MEPTKARNATFAGQTDVFAGLDPTIKVRTRKMMMWFIILAVVMLFGGITSAIIVLYGKLIWLHIVPVPELIISNVLIVVSSITLIAAHYFIKKGKQSLGFTFYSLTLALGIGFAISQNAAWNSLSSKGLGYTITQNEQGLNAYRWNTLAKLQGEYGKDFWFEMSNERLVLENGEYYNPSDPSKTVTNTVMTTFNAFGAMLSVLIYVHIIHLVFGLAYLLINTIRIKKGIINKDNTLSISVSGMYWHFMGILWLYLFAFMFFIF